MKKAAGAAWDEAAHAGSQDPGVKSVRAIFNHFPKRELLYSDAPSLKTVIDRMAYMTGDDEVAVSTRHGRGYVALRIAFSDTRYSRKGEDELGRALSAAFPSPSSAR